MAFRLQADGRVQISDLLDARRGLALLRAAAGARCRGGARAISRQCHGRTVSAAVHGGRREAL